MKNDSIIFPVVSTEEWAIQHIIPRVSRPCENCGEMLHTTKPFVTKGWRGLTSEPHGCNEGFDLFIAVKADPKERQEYIEFFNTLEHIL